DSVISVSIKDKAGMIGGYSKAWAEQISANEQSGRSQGTIARIGSARFEPIHADPVRFSTGCLLLGGIGLSFRQHGLSGKRARPGYSQPDGRLAPRYALERVHARQLFERVHRRSPPLHPDPQPGDQRHYIRRLDCTVPWASMASRAHGIPRQTTVSRD